MPSVRPSDQHIERIDTPQASDPVAHCLWNRSDRVARVLVVGTRTQTDCITYPDHDRRLLRDRSQPEDTWTDLEGRAASSPYAG